MYLFILISGKRVENIRNKEDQHSWVCSFCLSTVRSFRPLLCAVPFDKSRPFWLLTRMRFFLQHWSLYGHDLEATNSNEVPSLSSHEQKNRQPIGQQSPVQMRNPDREKTRLDDRRQGSTNPFLNNGSPDTETLEKPARPISIPSYSRVYDDHESPSASPIIRSKNLNRSRNRPVSFASSLTNKSKIYPESPVPKSMFDTLNEDSSPKIFINQGTGLEHKPQFRFRPGVQSFESLREDSSPKVFASDDKSFPGGHVGNVASDSESITSGGSENFATAETYDSGGTESSGTGDYATPLDTSLSSTVGSPERNSLKPILKPGGARNKEVNLKSSYGSRGEYKVKLDDVTSGAKGYDTDSDAGKHIETSPAHVILPKSATLPRAKTVRFDSEVRKKEVVSFDEGVQLEQETSIVQAKVREIPSPSKVEITTIPTNPTITCNVSIPLHVVNNEGVTATTTQPTANQMFMADPRARSFFPFPPPPYLTNEGFYPYSGGYAFYPGATNHVQMMRPPSLDASFFPHAPLHLPYPMHSTMPLPQPWPSSQPPTSNTNSTNTPIVSSVAQQPLSLPYIPGPDFQQPHSIQNMPSSSTQQFNPFTNIPPPVGPKPIPKDSPERTDDAPSLKKEDKSLYENIRLQTIQASQTPPRASESFMSVKARFEKQANFPPSPNLSRKPLDSPESSKALFGRPQSCSDETLPKEKPLWSSKSIGDSLDKSGTDGSKTAGLKSVGLLRRLDVGPGCGLGATSTKAKASPTFRFSEYKSRISGQNSDKLSPSPEDGKVAQLVSLMSPSSKKITSKSLQCLDKEEEDHLDRVEVVEDIVIRGKDRDRPMSCIELPGTEESKKLVKPASPPPPPPPPVNYSTLPTSSSPRSWQEIFNSTPPLPGLEETQ